jgi:hypothetical protein
MNTIAKMIQDYHATLPASVPVVPALKARRVSSAAIIAQTFCCDVADIRDYRYHYGRTTKPVYAIGRGYYCVSPTMPRELGLTWEYAPDQCIAQLHNTVLWFASN